MVLRKFIEIDEEKCTGCGNCVTDCDEGALQIIDGVAKVVNEAFCDGLGACMSGCPEDALHIIEKDVAAYDEEAVEEHLEKIGRAPLKHSHSESQPMACGCPSSMERDFSGKDVEEDEIIDNVPSQLQQWPVQLHLVNPAATYFNKANILIAASCTAFSYGNFHNEFIKDHAIVIACPKLDKTEGYVEKLRDIILESKPASITVARMEVPCCGGLSYMVQEAIEQSGKKVPYLEHVISVRGDLL
jgi:Pyruvate/2-oxoacid:ferredoxin oxidoreductase delta subunit